MARYSEAHKKATQKWQKKAYDNILVRVPKGERDIYKAKAEERGVSLNSLIVEFLKTL